MAVVIEEVTTKNLMVYMNLAQGYEAEFSALTDKKPNAQGKFELDTIIGDEVKGYLCYVDNAPAGLIAIKIKSKKEYEIAEFYIVPCFRKQKYGEQFAHTIWKKYGGKWEIKQLEGAEYASIFWRSVIKKIPHKNYQEDIYEDSYWGRVRRQQFEVKL